MSSYIFNPPRYSGPFFEEDGLYLIAGYVYHVLAVADTKFGRLAWATFAVRGGVDVQTLNHSMYEKAVKL